jgi:hypothetical protein
MQDSRLASRVTVCALLSNGADSKTGNTSCDDDTAGVLQRGALLEKWGEQANGVEHSLDVKIHDLGESRVGMRIERLAPGSASVGEEDIHFVSVLLDLRKQTLYALKLGGVGRD